MTVHQNGDKSKRLDYAQWFARIGITVFIVEPGGKRPLGGNSWYLRQTVDPDQVAEWFETTKNANYGLHMGPEYVAIDLDLKPGIDGVAEFQKICTENGIDDFLTGLNTLTIATPGGGYHLIFRVPFPCANANRFPKGIDVRGALGYIVGAGSQDSRGTWEIVNKAKIAACPDWLLPFLKEPGTKDPQHHVPLVELDLPENIEQARLWLTEAKPAVEGDNGDDHTYEICCKMRDFGLSESGALEVLNESGWNSRCDPPWESDALEKKIENSFEYGQNRPGCAAESLQLARILAVRPADNYGLTDEKVESMFHPPTTLELVVTDTIDADIPETPADDDGFMSREESERFWYAVDEFAAITQVREFIIKGWLIAHGITALLAVRGTGKSTIALDIAGHLTNDLDWWGVPTMPGWCVIYLCGEDDESMILNVRAWEKYHRGKHGDKKIKLDGKRFLVGRGILNLTRESTLRTRLDEMRDWVGDRRCLVILDTWQRATVGSKSNADDEMEVIVKRAEYIAKQLHGPMIACFHPPKDGRMTIRGSAVQEDTSSGLWLLEKETDGSTLLWVQRAKGPGELNWRRFSKQQVKLPGKDSYDDPLTGIVAVEFGSGDAATFPKKGSKDGVVHTGTDPRLAAAEVYIVARKGKGIIAGSVLCEHVARACAEGGLTDGELQVEAEQVRAFFRGKVAKAFLAPYRHQYGGAGSDWVYEDKSD